MNYSPIALFVYKRPEHTRRTLESLMQCPEFAESPLYVFCDGVKKEEDREKVNQTRELVHSLLNETAKIIESSENKGLANSIIAGVSHICEIYGRVIVLEDDLVVAPEFLTFLNNALDKYQDEESVMQVSGYMFPIPQLIGETEALFLPFTYSWGWATWQRAWSKFDPQSTGWEVLKSDKNMRSRFDLDDNYGFFDMLNQQMSGKIDSWAVRWYWSVFKHNGYVLYPPNSYITNIGLDGSGTHGSWYVSQLLKPIQDQENFSQFILPNDIQIKEQKFEPIKKYLRSLQPKWVKLLKKLLIPSWIVKLRKCALAIRNYLV